MGQIVIRGVDDAVRAALRKRAALSGTSMGEQACHAPAKAVGLDREAALRRLDEIRRQIGRLEGESTLDDIRRDRRRDMQIRGCFQQVSRWPDWHILHLIECGLRPRLEQSSWSCRHG